MKELVPPSTSTKGRIEDPNPQSWKYDRNTKGDLLDDDGNVTRNIDRARKIWRQTRLPDPVGVASKYLVTLDDTHDKGKRVHQVTMYGISFPRFLYHVNPDDPRHPQMRLMTIALADNQHKAIIERAKETFVRVAPPRDDEGEYVLDADGKPLTHQYVRVSDLLILERYEGSVAEVGTGDSVKAMRKLRELEEENKRLREGNAPTAEPQEQLRQMLYGANLVDPDDDRPMAEILHELQAAMGERDHTKKTGKPKTK